MGYTHSNNRRSIRLPGFDYTYPTVYFVTILTWQRQPIFGEVIDHQVQLSHIGTIAHREWLELANRFTYVELDEFVIMPDHLHGLIILKDIESHEINRLGPTQLSETMIKPHVVPGSLGAIVRAYKSNVTRIVNFNRFRNNEPVWHRNYYEHIVRDENDLYRVQHYIRSNPLNWPKES